jgi:hypothetical protein
MRNMSFELPTRSDLLEDWQLLSRGTDPTTGLAYAHVGRRTYEGDAESVCIWRVEDHGGQWYTTGQWLSALGGWRMSRKTKLSCSWLHRKIINLAEEG